MKMTYEKIAKHQRFVAEKSEALKSEMDNNKATLRILRLTRLNNMIMDNLIELNNETMNDAFMGDINDPAGLDYYHDVVHEESEVPEYKIKLLEKAHLPGTFIVEVLSIKSKRTSYFCCPAFRQEYFDELITDFEDSGKSYVLVSEPAPGHVRANTDIRSDKVLNRLKEELDMFGDTNMMITVQRDDLERLVKGYEKIMEVK